MWQRHVKHTAETTLQGLHAILASQCWSSICTFTTKLSDMQGLTCIQDPCGHTRTIAHGDVMCKVLLVVLVIHVLTLEVALLLHIVPSEGLTHQTALHYNIITDAGKHLGKIRTLQTFKNWLSCDMQDTLACHAEGSKTFCTMVLLTPSYTSTLPGTPIVFAPCCSIKAGAQAYA